ncbi:histidyl-tRNA synthetase [Gregarina niphandrodes]|uniref:Histidyl-tRNA synthetase n=1 Tax=Gregarina niphandrodes TaxID=110365 RepID=A0A023B6V3_GRENI|nr:histidyl-tRNA synthetase [Gregarina niphandrodes]EZG66806.1 histidyl-tRNA synthetase [Gregarina niphandrodes]|eukprot:XP_011130478.1 histidyl-tRNA synthetase [Gregarina niphandrodes]
MAALNPIKAAESTPSKGAESAPDAGANGSGSGFDGNGQETTSGTAMSAPVAELLSREFREEWTEVPIDLAVAARRELLVMRQEWLQALLDTCVVIELTASSIGGCTFQPSVSHSDNLKTLLLTLRNMFEDSKVSRSKNKVLDAVSARWLHGMANYQSKLHELDKTVKAELEDKSVSVPADIRVAEYQRVRSSVICVGQFLASSSKAFFDLMLDTVPSTEAAEVYELVLNGVDSKCLEDAAVGAFKESVAETPLRFRECLEEAKQLVANTSPETGALGAALSFHKICAWMHHVTAVYLDRQKIETWNKGISKAPKKKLSLKFGKGISRYAERKIAKSRFEDLIDLEECIATCNTVIGRKPKVAKGCVDYGPEKMRIRESVFAHITHIFKIYGAVPIDTPVFELKEVLTNKYGEDSKLIYDMKDQGGEQLSLRYDLTVPFARYCATNNVDRIKRYHIGKVYRRDEPQLAKGRYREFYQCDIDFAGVAGLMKPDAEILTMLCHVLSTLRKVVGAFRIKVSHRLLLDGMMEFAGVPNKLIRAISSAIDKLDKEPWSEVRKEMVEAKNLNPEVADRLETLVQFSGTISETCVQLRAIPGLAQNKNSACVAALDFNTSLARGLDYYTGLIYEAVLIGDNKVGSIAAGGRYDKLIGMFSGKSIPAVGVSVGIERVFRMIEESCEITETSILLKETKEMVVLPKAECYITTIGDVDEKVVLSLIAKLRCHEIIATYNTKGKINFKKDWPTMLDYKCYVGLIIAQDEWEKEQQVQVKVLQTDGKSKDYKLSEEEALQMTKSVVDQARKRSLTSLLYSTFDMTG